MNDKNRRDVERDFLPDSCREHRCLCGQLLARLTPAGVELKCKRCRRVEMVLWDRQRG